MLELLKSNEQITGLENLTVGDFWRWAYSDILSNRNRSIFAEYIVGVALEVVETPRIEWDSVDLRYGRFKIEVKSSADIQSWHQERPSRITFSIRKAIEWDPATGKYRGERKRCADIYVFCHLSERDRLKVNVLNVPAWDFYVISLDSLNERCGEMKSISLSAVKKLAAACKFKELRAVVDSILERRSPV